MRHCGVFVLSSEALFGFCVAAVFERRSRGTCHSEGSTSDMHVLQSKQRAPCLHQGAQP